MTVRARLAVVCVTVVATFGVPSQVQAASFPRTLAGALPIAPGLAPGAHLFTELALPWRANTIGVTFAGRGEPSIQVRAHDASGWSGWSDLDVSDIGGDGKEARKPNERLATDPVWIGSADRVGIRIDTASRLRAVRLELLNTIGDARPPSIWDRLGRALRSFFTQQPAEAMTSTPRILRRSQWGANESWKRDVPYYAPDVKMVFIHHTDTTNSYSRSQTPAIIRGIYHYHVFSQGWNDIGYNFLVDRYGQIFEGRAGGVDQAVVGAHTMGFNTSSSGISLIGTFSTATPTSSMLRSLTYLTAWKMDVHHVPPVGTVSMYSYGNPRYSRGRVVSFNRISGHRDGYPTACPGNAMARRLPWLRSAVKAMGNPKIYVPRASDLVIRPDGDGKIEATRIVAGFSQSVTWTLQIMTVNGSVRRTFVGSGTFASAVWNGTDETGVLLPTARYLWKLQARAGSVVARPASGLLYLVTSHPDGSLLSDTTNGRYLLSQGTARSVSELIARANFGEITPTVGTGPSEHGRYAPSAAMQTLRAGTLLRVVDPAGMVLHYLWDGAQLRKFGTSTDGNGATVDTFTVLGYQDAAALTIDQTTLATLQPSGSDITDTSAHPAGSLIRDPATGILYVVDQTGLRPISTLSKRSWYRINEEVQATSGDLSHPVLTTNPVALRDGTLATGGDRSRWIIAGGFKRRFYDATMYTALGYSAAWLFPATQAELNAFQTGSTIG